MSKALMIAAEYAWAVRRIEPDGTHGYWRGGERWGDAERAAVFWSEEDAVCQVEALRYSEHSVTLGDICEAVPLLGALEREGVLWRAR